MPRFCDAQKQTRPQTPNSTAHASPPKNRPPGQHDQHRKARQQTLPAAPPGQKPFRTDSCGSASSPNASVSTLPWSLWEPCIIIEKWLQPSTLQVPPLGSCVQMIPGGSGPIQNHPHKWRPPRPCDLGSCLKVHTPGGFGPVQNHPHKWRPRPWELGSCLKVHTPGGSGLVQNNQRNRKPRPKELGSCLKVHTPRGPGSLSMDQVCRQRLCFRALVVLFFARDCVFKL